MKKVLLIEDDSALRENTAELLELSNYSVETAPNGIAGVEKAKKTLPDIIVCDIMMPELDGYGVLESLASNENTRQIPFIFLSAKTEHKDIRKGMDMGADDYLTKPFLEEELISAIESRLAKMAIMRDHQTQVEPVFVEKTSPLKTLDDLKQYFKKYGQFSIQKPSSFIYEEGNHSNSIYMLDSGVVKTCRMDEYGKELTTALFKSGDFFGYTNFDETAPYQESATVIEIAEVYSVGKEEFKKLLEDNYALNMVFINYIASNLSVLKEQLIDMAYNSVRKKTASTILLFVDKLKLDDVKTIRISRSDLASVAGIATESLIRALSSIKKDGLIEIEGRSITVLDQKGLEQVV
ncbi:response regulator [Spongiivirga sp. MCCC 1A20706]|uniref:response regulator n=1 Tax=Spongiivirga sp. MCCC 1A20706 TaxID=3160963 RepID=UPI0039778D60